MDKSKIKVVKKSDAVTLRTKTKKQRTRTSRAAAREIVSNVTGWVSDIKERKANETLAALDLLFGSKQRPSES